MDVNKDADLNDEQVASERAEAESEADSKAEGTADSKADAKADAKAAKPVAKKITKKSKDKKAVRIGSPRWVVPTMLALFGIGLLWIIVYYIAPSAPGIVNLGAWNVLIGFVLISLGFVVSTRWK